MSVDEEAWTELVPKGGLARSSLRQQPLLSFSDSAGPRQVKVSERSVIGSSADAPIAISDRKLSRLHAEVDLRSDGLWIRDLGSTNGTFVEGVRVERALVPPGGRILLGQTTLTLTYAETPSKVLLWPHDRFGPLVGRSEAMRDLFMRLSQYAASDATVLVQGETGTGKELVAAALHEASDRSSGPLVVVDCGALPETLLESELFGHARGAFTGASHVRVGAIESAHGGTLFLDEIGELPLAMQPKLLRAIEAKTIRRLGESEHRPVDVRYVAATHRDLQSMVALGAFREDLYFRLSVLPALVPPLRSRTEDIGPLLQHFLVGRRAPPSRAFVDGLAKHPWLGNVRELRNLAERIVVVGEEQAWTMTQQPAASEEADTSTSPELPVVRVDVPFKTLRERWLDHLERGYMEALIATYSRNVTAIAEAAELDRTYVHRLLRKHDL